MWEHFFFFSKYFLKNLIKLDNSAGSSGGMSGKGKSRPDGRVHHTLTVFPSCWAPRKEACVDWLRSGLSLVFMYGGRRFVQPPSARRGDPSKGRYRPSPTIPTNELWTYTPQLYKWQNLTDFCKVWLFPLCCYLTLIVMHVFFVCSRPSLF